MAVAKPLSGLAKTPRDFAPLNVNMELLCRGCGQKGQYPVGRLFLDPAAVTDILEKKKDVEDGIAFSGYFHCHHCGAGGPWGLTGPSRLQFTALLLEALRAPDEARLHFVQMHLFDGTVTHSGAEAEAHLKKLLEASPDDHFLWSRLGNVYAGAERPDLALHAYQKAVELNPRDVESH